MLTITFFKRENTGKACTNGWCSLIFSTFDYQIWYIVRIFLVLWIEVHDQWLQAVPLWTRVPSIPYMLPGKVTCWNSMVSETKKHLHQRKMGWLISRIVHYGQNRLFLVLNGHCSVHRTISIVSPSIFHFWPMVICQKIALGASGEINKSSKITPYIPT